MAEIQVTDEQGTTHIFPDGSTPEMIAKAMNVHVQGAPAQAQQPGFWENLGHTFGIGQQEQQARQQDFEQHPVISTLKAALGPAYQAAAGIGSEFMRSTGEAGQAVDALRSGNPAQAATHAISAVPIVGPALTKMAAEAPPTTPGQSYASKVLSASTPGNIGTGLGAALQLAPAALGALDEAAPNRPVVPNPPIKNPLTVAKNIIAGPPEVQMTKALQPGKNNINFSADLKTAMPQMKSAEAQLGQPIGGFDDAAQASALAKKNIWQQVQSRLDSAGQVGATIDGNSIADAMMDSIDKRMALQNPNLVSRIKTIADTYRRDIPVNEAEDFIQSNNAELTGYYARNKISQQAAQADPEIAAKIAEGDALRSSLYSKIDDLSGPGVAQLKKTYGALTNIQKELAGQQMIYARKAPVNLGEQLGYLQAGGKILTGDVLGGIKDIAVRRFLSDVNDKNSMIARSFENAQPAQPFLMPRAMPTIKGQLPASTGGPFELPPANPMSPGERSAALMQMLRRRQQLALPANVPPTQLPPSF